MRLLISIYDRLRVTMEKALMHFCALPETSQPLSVSNMFPIDTPLALQSRVGYGLYM